MIALVRLFARRPFMTTLWYLKLMMGSLVPSLDLSILPYAFIVPRLMECRSGKYTVRPYDYDGSRFNSVI